jgi:hypothetical protein
MAGFGRYLDEPKINWTQIEGANQNYSSWIQGLARSVKCIPASTDYLKFNLNGFQSGELWNVACSFIETRTLKFQRVRHPRKI